MYSLQFSALLLAALAAMVLLKERKASSVSLAGGLSVIALIQVFDYLALLGTHGSLHYLRAAIFLKALMPACFLLYGRAYRARGREEFSRVPFAVLALIGTAFVLSSLVVPLEYFFSPEDFRRDRLLPLGKIGYWYYLGLMIFCVAALVDIEAVFASIRGGDRWKLKYEFLGVGSILGVFISYFSQGLLFQSVNLGLLPARSGVLILAALLIGYSRLFRGQSRRVVVSRYVFYRSFTLLGVALYLLAVGLTGQFIRSFHISLSKDALLLAAVVSWVAFLALLFSEEVRSRVRVLVAKHFFASKHDYREQWRGFSSALASCRSLDAVQRVIIEAYVSTYGLRSAALYVRAAGGESFSLGAAQGREGLPRCFVPSPGLVGYFVETGRVLNPRDGEYTPTPEEDEFFRNNQAWLLVPLLAGSRLEAVALFGEQFAAERPTYEDYDLMKILGRQAVLSLNNFRLSEELAEVREMAAVAKVSSFVIHDLKNVAYTFSLMMENADEHIGEPEFQRDLVNSIHGTVAKMNALIAKLKAFPEKMELNRESVDLAVLTRETLDEVRKVKPAIVFDEQLTPVAASGDALELRKVILNLLLNACDAVGGEGEVRVTSARRAAAAVLSIEDNGCGMSRAFMQGHLFKPFRTTKEKGLGIGLYQCRQIVEAHNGRIEVASREGEGTVFTVVLPATVPGSA